MLTLVAASWGSHMAHIFCPSCRLRQPAEHSYCVSCGAVLPSHLLEEGPSKVARFFAGVKVDQGDPENGFLRVSCYLKDNIIESDEGSARLPGNHVRFSVWVHDRAKCVLSLPGSEARELASFLHRELARVEAEGAQPRA
jgi:hypothetical protein